MQPFEKWCKNRYNKKLGDYVVDQESRLPVSSKIYLGQLFTAEIGLIILFGLIKMEFTKFKKSDPIPSINFDLRRELWLLVYAINSCKLVCHLCDLLLSGEHKEADNTYTGIVNAIYVAYSRSFHWCGSIGRLTADDLTPDLLEIHTEMIHLRDKLYAHKDLNAYQVEEEIFNTVRAVVIDGKMSLLSNELIPRGPKIAQIQLHAKRIIVHFNERCKRLYQEIRRPGWPLDGEYILNMDPYSEDIFRSVSESESTKLIKKITE